MLGRLAEVAMLARGIAEMAWEARTRARRARAACRDGVAAALATELREGRLVTDAQGYAPLPERLASLTLDGTVWCARDAEGATRLLFVVWRGRGRNAGGYLWSSAPWTAADLRPHVARGAVGDAAATALARDDLPLYAPGLHRLADRAREAPAPFLATPTRDPHTLQVDWAWD